MCDVIADELLDVFMSPASTAYDVWAQLHLLFRDNQPDRAIILSAEFRNIVQGGLFIPEYSRRLKSLTDALGDVGGHIIDQTLTLQLTCSLSRKFQVMATPLPMQVSFPSFVQARSRLLMEITANERARLDGRPESTSTVPTIGQASHSGSIDCSFERGASAHANKGKVLAIFPTPRRTRARVRGRGSLSAGGTPGGCGALAPAPCTRYSPLWGLASRPTSADILRRSKPTR